jgi:hypothetical protein
VDKAEFAKRFQEGTEIRKMIVAFIRALVQPGSGLKHLRKQASWTDRVWEVYERTTGQRRPGETELDRPIPRTSLDTTPTPARLGGTASFWCSGKRRMSRGQGGMP